MDFSKYTVMAKASTSASPLQAWMAFQIWHNKPHVINRRLSGAISLYTGELVESMTIVQLYYKIIDSNITSNMTDEEIERTLSELKCFKSDDDHCTGRGIIVAMKKLIPRNAEVYKSILEITVFDEVNCKVIFFKLPSVEEDPTLTPHFAYSLECAEGEIRLLVYGCGSESLSSTKWLKSHMFPKIQKWAESSTESNLDSLSLVPLNKYTQLYQDLKKKYAHDIIKMWPECTDPQKFVYEDVAIASYLLLLWEEQSEARGQPNYKQTFVDLGCGNGLLVHILCSEGYKGIGLDVRKRTIWDCYPSSTELKVQTITPSDNFLFPETDWIIGNHSDELTPWIPVIATRSSYNCSYFVLPCCCYDFNGSKYQRYSSSLSMYMEYLDYIQKISELCGFDTVKDKLRIPSTKRICLIGSRRNHPENQMDGIKCKVTKFINLRCNGKTNELGTTSLDDNETWVSGFKPRDQTEKVRNCTQLDKKVVNEVINLVASILLQNKQPVNVIDGTWNAGQLVALGEVASVIPKQLLQQLKNECGGLQTLLKNNHHIFHVVNGKVQLRAPVSKDKCKKMRNDHKFKRVKLSYKVKPCWFYHNHPDGCPLQDSDCTFQH